MPRIELIYDVDCPNIDSAREQLRKALSEIEHQPSWQEWDRRNPSSPAYAAIYGSPTILVDGRDVMVDASPSGGGDCCRVYLSDDGRFQGVPPFKAIVSALLRCSKNEAIATHPRVVATTDDDRV